MLVCTRIFVALSLLAAGAAHAALPQFFIVDYNPVSKTAVPNSQLYDYVYRVDVYNSGGAASSLAGKVVSKRSSVTVTDGNAAFGSVAARTLKPSTDTIKVRAHKHFDRRLDRRVTRHGHPEFEIDGTDPEDTALPGHPHPKWGDLRPYHFDALFLVKSLFVFEWTFTTQGGDTTAPAISGQAPVGNVGNARPAISASYQDAGGGVNAARTALKVDNVDVTAQSQVTATGVTHTPATALAQGNHAVTLSVFDAAGNTATANWSFTVDTLAPVVSGQSPKDTPAASPRSTIAAQFNDATTGVSVARVVLRVDGVDVTAQATVTAAGVSYTPATPLTNGAHAVVLHVEDQLGNAVDSSWSFSVDGTGPAITNPQPFNAVLAADALPAITATFSDSGVGVDTTRVTLEVDGLAVPAQVTATGVSFTPSTVLAEGPHTVKLKATDLNSNTSELGWTFTTRTLPEIANGSPKDVIVGAATTVTIAAQFSDVGSGIDATRTTVTIDGVDFTAQASRSATGFTLTPSPQLADGLHLVVVTVSDNAGNVNSSSWRFKVDTGAPYISETAPKNILTNNELPTITAKYQDIGADTGSGIDVSRIRLTVDGVDVTSAAAITATELTYVPAMRLSSALHTIVLTVVDFGGNSTETTWSFLVDALGVVISNQSPVDTTLPADAVPTISAQFADLGGAGIDIATVKLEVDGVDVTPASGVTGAQVTFTPVNALTEGNHAVTLTVRDQAGNVATSSWQFTTATAPAISATSPKDVRLDSASTPTITAALADVGAGVDAARVTLSIDGADVTAAAAITASGVAFTTPQPLIDGRHQVTLTVFDRAGNSTTESWYFTTARPPEITGMSPRDVVLPEGSRPPITAQFSDPRVGINVGSVLLFVNGVDVTSQAQIDATSVSYTPSAPLAPGPYTVSLSVENATNAAAEAAWGFQVDTPATYDSRVLSPAPGATLRSPQVDVAVVASASKTHLDSVEVNGRFGRQGPDTAEGDFTVVTTVALVPGENTLNVRVAFADGQIRNSTLVVFYDAPPVVAITSPVDFTTLGAINPNSPRDLTGNVERPVTITGTVSRPGTQVTVNQQVAAVAGNTFSFQNFFLHEGVNLITVVGTDDLGRIGSSSITVYVDQTAPLLTLEAPGPKAVTSNARIDLRGIVNDAVEGGVAAPYPTVRVVNAANGASVVAKVGDRFFIAEDVPLEVGANELTVTATDHLGNARVGNSSVTRVAVGSSRLTIVSGNRQRAPFGTELPKPLAVAAMDKDGNPLAGIPVAFEVLRGTGGVSPSPGGGAAPGTPSSRRVVVNTNGSGTATVHLTVGRQSGEAGNMVRASNPEIGEDVVFTATSQRGIAAFVVVEGGGTQYAEAGTQPIEALSALVFDSERNPLPNAPVTFRVEEGDATIAGAAATVVNTDKDGRAMVRPLLGIKPGIVKVGAVTSTNPGDPANGRELSGAVFQIYSLEQTDGPTQFGGTVLDHVGSPIPGVRLSIGRTSLSTTTDPEGRFLFESDVPPGRVDLFVDGRVATVSGRQYPALHFEVTAVRGQRNVLPHAIYLPPLLTSEAKIAGGNADVVLRIPGFEGFEMVVKANSVTFPDGSKVGPLVVSPVYIDKLPMVPPGGAAAFAAPAWTIQPNGVRFDPPVEVRMPNNNWAKPGETKDVYQWDHDLSAFVPMGRATVTEDGALLITDPGSGITKAGWGGSTRSPPPQQQCGIPSSECGPCREFAAGVTDCPGSGCKFKEDRSYEKVLTNPIVFEADISKKPIGRSVLKYLKLLPGVASIAAILESDMRFKVIGTKQDVEHCCASRKGTVEDGRYQGGIQAELFVNDFPIPGLSINKYFGTFGKIKFQGGGTFEYDKFNCEPPPGEGANWNSVKWRRANVSLALIAEISFRASSGQEGNPGQRPIFRFIPGLAGGSGGLTCEIGAGKSTWQCSYQALIYAKSELEFLDYKISLLDVVIPIAGSDSPPATFFH